MNEHLWAGVDFKTEMATFHLDRMSRSLEPPDQTYEAVRSSRAGPIEGATTT
ncbi:MAG: hypothetical protein JWN85_1048 [Gammaproteobacteria bacterium]|nr:hypothetical protein [Gammaproteobacteria bacterium]